MAIAYTALDKNTNTFEDWLARTNALSADMTNSVITTGNNNTGSVEISGEFTSNTIVTQSISASANLAIGSSTDITGGLTVSGAFDVNGAAQFDGTVTVAGTTLTITSNTTISANKELDIHENSKLFFGSKTKSSNNYMYGTSNASPAGEGAIGFTKNAYVGGRLFINGGLTFANTSSTFIVESDLTVNGANTTISGDMTVNNSLTANTITSNGDLTVNGNIIVSGTVDGRDVATDGAKLDTIDEDLDIGLILALGG